MEIKQPSFRWQLSDFLTLFVAFSFTAVFALHPSWKWAELAAGATVAWWVYCCLKAGRRPSGYQLAVICVAIGVYLMLVSIIQRLMERGFSWSAHV